MKVNKVMMQGFPGLSRNLTIFPGLQGLGPFVQGSWD